jgi:site-specific DNA recombinase
MIIDCYKPPAELKSGSTVWAYLRDSGGETQERSVGQQEAVIKNYCSEYGLILDQIYTDEAKSGGSLKGREQFRLMIDNVELGRSKPDGILVWNNARFGRDVQDSQYYRLKVRRLGIVFHSLTDPIPEGNVGIVTEAVIDYSNQEKREQMSRDIKRGQRAQLMKGYASGGPAPKGYKAEYVEIGQLRSGKPRIVPVWVPDPELWDLCRLAWEMRAEGCSYREIHEATKKMVYKSRLCWATFFRNKTYLGVGKCGELELENHHEAMISKEIWDKVQAIHYGDPRYGRNVEINQSRRISNPSLLSGLAKCAFCGSAMVISRDRRKNWGAYKCGRKNRWGKEFCVNRQINSRKADQLVLDTVLNRILTLDFALSIFERVRTEVNGSNAVNERIDLLKKEQQLIDRNIERAIDMGMSAGVSDKIKERLKAYNLQARKVQIELADLEVKLKAAKMVISNEAMIRVLKVWRERIVEAQEAEDLTRMRKLLSYLVDHVDMGYNPENERFTRIWYQFPIDGSAFSANDEKAAGSTLLLSELFPMAVGSWSLDLEWV